MNEEYEKELSELKEKMVQAELLAEKFPYFKKTILRKKITGTSDCIDFGESYKKLPLDWGIKRIYYDYKKTPNRTITNYREGNPKKHLFNLYFNSYSLFDNDNYYGLEKIKDKVNVFFYDELNTTFYIEDEHIEKFLELANKWYIKASKLAHKERLQIQKEKLEKQLKELD